MRIPCTTDFVFGGKGKMEGVEKTTENRTSDDTMVWVVEQPRTETRAMQRGHAFLNRTRADDEYTESEVGSE